MKFKKRIVGLMLMAALFVAPLASCFQNENPAGSSSSVDGGVTSVPFEDTGAYYCTTPNGEYTLTIGEDDCQWVMGAETLEGTYVYDGETLTFSFTNGVTATATLDGTMLTLKKGSEVYIFYKNVSYNVELKVGDTSTTQSVVNGKKAVAPEDPTLKGYWFVGWYTSDGKLYNFNTPVTGDLSLTARFIEEVEQQEFEVTLYVDGEEYDVLNTRGGKLYENELPVPQQEGKTFLGWWVGYSAEKLSYKYAEQTLGQDTALYAVWKSAAPVVSVTGESITWTAAGSGLYKVTVKNANGQTVVSTTTPDLSYSIGFAGFLEGEYTVEVCDDANPNLKGVAYYRNKTLDKIGYFDVDEENRILVFNEIENATKYLITAYCGDSAHSHVKVESTSPVFDFSACQMKEGGITFQVEAIADGYVSSVSEVYAYEAQLDAVTGLEVNDETESASWNAVENAEYYVVEIIDDGVSLGKVQTTNTEVSLRGLTGNLEVKVYPYARAFNSSATQSVSYQNTRLATPTNIKLNGEDLVWDAVANATYVVMIDSTEYPTENNSFTLSDDYFSGDSDSISIKVKAVPTGTGTESRYSDVFTVRLNNTMDASTLSYGAGKATWGAVFLAEKYGVRVNYGNGNYSDEVLVEGVTSCPITFTGAGAVTIEVRSYVKDRASEWAVSEPVNVYRITFDAEGGVEVAPYYKANGDPVAEWPKTTYKGYTFEGWYDIPNALEDNGVKQESPIFQGDRNVVLFAGYTPNTYKVTYSLDENAVLDKENADVVYYKDYKLDVPTSKDAAKMFAGWYTEPNGRGIQYTDMYGNSLNVWTTANDDVVVYPAWYEVLSFTEVTENGETTYAVAKNSDTVFVEYLTIPAEYNGVKVTTIDAAAFANCGSLKEVKVPDTVTFIYLSSDNQELTNSAFTGCSMLEKITIYCANGEGACNHEVYYESDEAGALLYNNPVTSKKEIKYLPDGFKGDEYEIPYGVEVIPTSAFYGRSLKKIIIPASVTQIDSSAFAGCTLLNELIFLEAAAGVEEQTLTLSNNIFENCDSLKVLNLPKRVADLSAYINPTDEDVDPIFNTWMTDINITGKAVPDADVYETYYSIDGVLFQGQSLIYVPRAKAGAYRIPQKGDANLVITTIETRAFKNCSNLTSVSIPEWITLIKYEAFAGCGMTTLTFEATDEDVEYGTTLDIEDRAFYGGVLLGSGVKDLTLPVNLNKLGANAFYNADKECYNTITVLGDGANFSEAAFASNSGTSYVHNIYLGKNVENIAISSVFGTYNVHEVNVDEDNPYMVSYDGVIYNKAETEIMYFPYGKAGSFEIRDTVTKLGSKLFAGTQITAITIPASVTEIESYAFAKCQKLQTVTWVDGDQALTIGDGAFAGDTALADFYVPARVSYIGKGAFANCSFTSLEIKDGDVELTIDDYAFKNVPFEGSGVQLDFDWVSGMDYGTGKSITNGKLTSITLPTRLRSIGTEAFYYAFDVKVEASIVIPEGVTTIGNRAFARNSGLTSISLPSTLTKMGAYADDALTSMLVFEGCNALKTVTVADGNTAFKVIDGVLYGVTEGVVTDLYMSPIANSGDANGNVDIPRTITKIWDGAFKNNTGIKSITFKNGVDKTPELGAEIFYSCKALESIQLPEGLDKISTAMFSSCNALTSVSIPSTVATIELEAFKSCANLTSIVFAETPDGQTPVDLTLADGVGTMEYGQLKVTSIFSGCSKLKEILLPERTKYIGQYAFYGLALDKIAIPASVTEIGENAFYKCTSLTEVTFSGTSQLTSIPTYLFRDCSALTTINIPASVTEIGENAFYGCTSLSSVTLNEGLVTIGKAAFIGTALKTINIPASVKTIGVSAFEKCRLMTAVTFDEDSVLETIDELAFSDCESLLTIKIPASVTTIGDAAFICCESLATVNFVETDNKLASIGNNAFASSGVTNFTFPESTATLTFGEAIFEGCALGNVHLSSTIDSITGIFDGATVESITVSENSKHFSAVEGQKVLFNKDGDAISIVYGEVVGALNLADVTAGDVELTQIGRNAFKNQTKLTSVIIPTTVEEISASAFYGCTALTNVTFAQESGVVSALATIGASAFEGCTALKEVVLPDNVTTLGDNAFYNCPAITNIELNAKLATVGTKVFAGATALETLTIPEGVKTIGNYMFAKAGALAGKLTTITVPSTVTSIGEGAFAGTESAGTSGSTVYVPASQIILTDTAANPSQLKEIGKGAFQHCKNLTTLVIPDSVTSIGTHTFTYCESLTSITLPENDSITTIGQYMFYGCKAMTSFTIPDGITTIEANAFVNASGLTSLTIPASVTTIGNYAFRYTTGLRSVTFAEPEAGATTKAVTLGTNVFELSAAETTEFTVTFSSQITEIGGAAFKNRGLTSVVLPESITKLGNTSAGVFEGCALLTEATLGGKNLTQMGYYLFRNCTSLNTVTLREGTAFLGYTKTGTTTSAKLFAGCTSETFTLNLPSTVTTISKLALCTSGSASASATTTGLNITSIDLTNVTKVEEAAFAGCAKLTDVTWGSKLTNIGKTAFYGCTGLTSVSTTATTIGQGAFQNCTGLVTADISKISATNTNTYIFSGCTALTSVTLNDALTTIAANMFENCTSLTSFTLPSKTKTINANAFKGCTALTGISNLSQVTKILSSAFENCTSLTSADISNATETNIKSSTKMFSGCTALTSVTLNSALKTIPAQMFQNCTSLTGITLPSTVTYIGANAFAGSGLTSIDLSATSITNFASSATGKTVDTNGAQFMNCVNLTEVKLPSTVTIIGKNIFKGCTSLTNINWTDLTSLTLIGVDAFGDTAITSFTVPASLVTLHPYAFYGTELSTISVAEGASFKVMDKGLYDANNMLVAYPFAQIGEDGVLTLPEGSEGILPSTTTSYYGSVFSGVDKVKTVIIPSSMASIGKYAFYKCVGLESITIPTTVTEIGQQAFFGCTSLSSVIFEDSESAEELTFVTGGSGALFGGTALTSVKIPARIKNIPNSMFGYSATTSGYYADQLTEIIIEEGVETIGTYAFANLPITSITLPSTLTTIGANAFNGAQLSSIAIPANVTSIGNGAFTGTMLTSVTISAQDITWGSAFKNSTYLEEVTIEDGVTAISNEMFSGCTALTTVNIADSVTSIGQYAFQNCTALANIDLPDSLTAIGARAFMGCTALESIVIPDGVTNLTGNSAATITTAVTSTSYIFADCTSLASVTLPANLEWIGGYTFQNCTALTSIEIPESVNVIGNSAFAGTGITTIEIKNPEIIMYASFQSMTALETAILPEGLTALGFKLFYDCVSLKNITIPSTVTTFDTVYPLSNGKTSSATGYTFAGCLALESIVIPESVTVIPIYAFAMTGPNNDDPRMNLKSITLPSTIVEIRNQAFSGCSSIESIVIPRETILTDTASGLVSQFKWWTAEQTIYICATKSFVERNWYYYSASYSWQTSCEAKIVYNYRAPEAE